MASKKLHLDKYYTSQELADYCTQKAIEVIGRENITELIESSAGNGVFLNSFEKLLPEVPYKAYDIEPEDDRIIKQDYLSLDMEYKRGRVVGFNFPYGEKNTLSVKFYKKSLEFGDYVCSILPISQLNNNQQMYEFDLVYSEDLKPKLYSNVKVHCCFNIYKRNNKGLNEKTCYKLKDLNIIESRFGKRIPNDYDLRLLAWGTGLNGLKLGGFLNKGDKQYSKEFFIKINNENLKEKIVFELDNVDWTKIYPMTATPNLLQWQVYKYLKENIEEIE
jgi:hypothetical protein